MNSEQIAQARVLARLLSVAEQREVVDGLLDGIERLRAERDRLRELLRPAAAFADVLDSDEIFKEMREPETIIATLDDAVLTASDCYAARAALEQSHD